MSGLLPDQSDPLERTIYDVIAAAFHANYERLAPDYGYATREASAVPWRDVPEPNKRLMRATVRELVNAGVIRVG